MATEREKPDIMNPSLPEDDIAVIDREKEEDSEIKPPPRYAVVLLNDDFTPMDFVAMLLIKYFNRTVEEAGAITMEVHNKGEGVAGIFSRDIAETKSVLVNEISQENGHPLKSTIRPVDDE